MKQIKTFRLPEEESAANEFLAVTAPESVITFDKMVVVNYDDQTYPDAYKKEELMALMLSNTKQSMTTQISLDVSRIDLERFETELADLRATVIGSEGKEKYDDEKDKEEKVKAFEDRVNNLKRAIQELEESLVRFETRNKVMKELVDSLN